MKKFWTIQNQADADSAELMLYGEISDTTWWGDEVTPKQFADDLKALGGKNLVLRVNSPGGDVFAAQAIYNQLKAYGGSVTAYIDGLAASAATIITCAADKVIMPDNAIFMIHNPKVAVIDYMDAPSLTSLAEQLDAVKQTILNVYRKKCSSDISDVKLRHMMDSETWMTATEAKEMGFVDELADSLQVENSIKSGKVFMNNVSFDLKRFQHGEQLQAMLNKEEKQSTMNEKSILSKIKNLLNGEQVEEQGSKDVDVVAVERQRMLDLDAMRDGNEAIDKIVDIAKRNGNTAEQIREYVDAVKGCTAEAKQDQGIEEIKALVKDQMASGAEQITPTVTDIPKNDAKDDVSGLIAAMKKLRGE